MGQSPVVAVAEMLNERELARYFLELSQGIETAIDVGGVWNCPNAGMPLFSWNPPPRLNPPVASPVGSVITML